GPGARDPPWWGPPAPAGGQSAARFGSSRGDRGAAATAPGGSDRLAPGAGSQRGPARAGRRDYSPVATGRRHHRGRDGTASPDRRACWPVRRAAPPPTRTEEGSRGRRVPRATDAAGFPAASVARGTDRKSTRLNSSHVSISYAVFCLKKKNNISRQSR